jgi:hypothetical protein
MGSHEIYIIFDYSYTVNNMFITFSTFSITHGRERRDALPMKIFLYTIIENHTRAHTSSMEDSLKPTSITTIQTLIRLEFIMYGFAENLLFLQKNIMN